MAWFLFIDESGHDRRKSPYEVLAGIAVKDDRLWDLILALHAAEIRHFGRRYSNGTAELKGTKILKTKVFRHTELNCSVAMDEVASLAKSALDDGSKAGVRELKALALAKLAYVSEVFETCLQYGCRAFASIVETNAQTTASDVLRKDYAYLFQRFFYFLDERSPREQGIVVFDELEKSRSHILIDQTHRYFKDTATGRQRASLIIPEPLFVHSDLTTGIQIADLVAYCISWGFRTAQMPKPFRRELAERYGQQVSAMRYRTDRDINGRVRTIWSYAHIMDLRTRSERELDE
jgi:hypothetical protein